MTDDDYVREPLINKSNDDVELAQTSYARILSPEEKTLIQKNNEHAAIVQTMLKDIDLGEVKGIRANPVGKEPLTCGETMLYWVFNIIMTCLTLGLNLLCCSFYTLKPMQARILIAFGKIYKVVDKQGLYWQPKAGIEFIKVNLSIQTLLLRGSSVPDASGSPLEISTMLCFTITDPVASQFAVEHLRQFIENTSMDVIRRACGKFRYRSTDPNEITLSEDSHHVCRFMRDLLQKRCEIAGVEIMRMDFIEMRYATEVATGLLQVQQAQARVEARQLIVKGSTEISVTAIDQLEHYGVTMGEDEKQELVKSLMTLTCSDSGHCQPIIHI